MLPPAYDHIHDSELEDVAFKKILQGDLNEANALRGVIVRRRRESESITKFVFAPHEDTFRRHFFLTKKDSDLVFGLLEAMSKKPAEDKATE